jgi:hypothetical protein
MQQNVLLMLIHMYNKWNAGKAGVRKILSRCVNVIVIN